MQRAETKEEKRERFKTNDDGEMVVIPAKAIYSNDPLVDRKLRVAAYCRVSTPDEAQTSSCEIQRNYYEKYIRDQGNWIYSGIYADEGISGTNRRKRDQFNLMINDCVEGKIDLIITKSVSRFSRNVVDCLSVVRQLGNLTPRVGVLFQTENINTFQKDSEIFLTILAAFSQEESRAKSESMLWSYERRYNNQNFMTPTESLLGYDKADGRMVIEPEGAKTVRLIYAMYLAGYKMPYIARILENLRRPTGKNNYKWGYAGIRGILLNERYCGDIVAQKTYTKDFFEHTVGKNRGQRPVYYKAHHHEGIVTQDEYIQALMLLSSKGKNRAPGYRLTVIRNGLLSGFIPINCLQGGYTAEHYVNAYEQADLPGHELAPMEIVNFPGCQVVRTQECGKAIQPTLQITAHRLSFNRHCISLLSGAEYVELLLHPMDNLLAVRPCEKDHMNAFEWGTEKNRKKGRVDIAASAFAGVLYQLMSWESNWYLRMQAVPLSNGDERVILFDLRETEYQMFLDEALPVQEGEKPKTARRRMTLLNPEWRESFGRSLPEHVTVCRFSASCAMEQWDTDAPGEAIPGFDHVVNIKSPREIQGMIDALATE